MPCKSIAVALRRRASGFHWNNRAVPDGDWWDVYPDSKLIVVKNGVRYIHPITFKGE